MTSVGENEEKVNTIQLPPSCVFLTFNWYLEPWSVVLTLNSVTEKEDPKEFSWWKTNFYSYVMGLNEEL